MNKQVVIFGLAANPIHAGHIAVAKELAKHKDEVWLSPCCSHMHDKRMANAQDRLEMARLAIDSLEKIKICSIEIDEELAIPTYEFLNKLKDRYPEIDFSFAIGQDNADSIEKWKYHKELITEFPFVVLPRGEEQGNGQWYTKSPHIFLPTFELLEISSTEIRQNVEQNKQWLHPAVYEYIQQHKLYNG